MLKITLKRDDGSSTLLLEGKLAGPWVAEVQGSWEGARADGQKVSLDLNGVTFIDAEGKALLTKLHQEGAILICRGCLTRAIVAQACGEPFEAATHPNEMKTPKRLFKKV